MVKSTCRQPMSGGLSGIVIVALLMMVSPQLLSAQEVTYAKDVAPILRASCESCHRPGTAAPMQFQTYEQTRPWASMIKYQVEKHLMPPGWYIDRTVGIQHFKNDPTLSEEDIATIVQWVDAGAPEGDEAAMLPALDMRLGHEYWQIEEEFGWGQPDVIIESPPYTVQANGRTSGGCRTCRSRRLPRDGGSGPWKRGLVTPRAGTSFTMLTRISCVRAKTTARVEGSRRLRSEREWTSILPMPAS